MSATLILQDFPMACCGMMQGHGFSAHVNDGTTYNKFFNRVIAKSKYPEEEDYKERLRHLIEESRRFRRNCAMIVLSSDQRDIKNLACEMGFKTIQSFYNPNSGNMCHIMTYLHFESQDDYNEEWGGAREDEEDAE